MTNSIVSNQFSQSVTVGMQDLTPAPGTVISALVDQSYSGTFNAGTPVKLVATSTGIPKVVPITADSDDVFGIALFSVKNGYYSNAINNGALEVGLKDTVVYMRSGAAIVAGAGVSTNIGDANTGTVIPQTGAAKRIGFALDAASASNQLIRIYLETPNASTSGTTRTINVTATLAQINAGLVIIPGSAGKQITVTDFTERVTGAFASGTSVDLRSDATGVIVESTAEAGLTNGAVLRPTSANVTLGAGFATPLPAAEGLKVVNVGAAQTVGTSIQFTVTYTQA